MIAIDKEKYLLILLSERLDSMNADEAKSVVTEALKDLDRDVLLDVTELEYISSAGLQVILRCAKTAQKYQKACLLKGAHGTIREIFQVSGFLTFLKEIE